MTYYMLLLLLLYGGVQAWHAYKEKTFKLFSTWTTIAWSRIFSYCSKCHKSTGHGRIYPVQYARKSELTIDANQQPQEKRSGLSYAYITQFSYGIFESLNLIVPRIQGGGSTEDLGRNQNSIMIYFNWAYQGASQPIYFKCAHLLGKSTYFRSACLHRDSRFFFAILALSFH